MSNPPARHPYVTTIYRNVDAEGKPYFVADESHRPPYHEGATPDFTQEEPSEEVKARAYPHSYQPQHPDLHLQQPSSRAASPRLPAQHPSSRGASPQLPFRPLSPTLIAPNPPLPPQTAAETSVRGRPRNRCDACHYSNYHCDIRQVQPDMPCTGCLQRNHVCRDPEGNERHPPPTSNARLRRQTGKPARCERCREKRIKCSLVDGEPWPCDNCRLSRADCMGEGHPPHRSNQPLPEHALAHRCFPIARRNGALARVFT